MSEPKPLSKEERASTERWCASMDPVDPGSFPVPLLRRYEATVLSLEAEVERLRPFVERLAYGPCWEKSSPDTSPECGMCLWCSARAAMAPKDGGEG